MRRRASRASRRLTLAAVAVAVAGGLAFQRYAEDLERTARPGGPLIDVVVAARDLARGSTLHPDDLEVVEIPEGFAPPGAVATPEALVGRTLLAPVAEGEPVTRSRLGAAGGPVAALIPYGLRAVALTTPLPRGSVAPGDHVDVMATFATGRPYTDTVVESAEVLQVLVSESSAEHGGTTLVLLVSPEDAERVAYARAFADLSVAIAPRGG